MDYCLGNFYVSLFVKRDFAEIASCLLFGSSSAAAVSESGTSSSYSFVDVKFLLRGGSVALG